jgi:hypothetical protein
VTTLAAADIMVQLQLADLDMEALAKWARHKLLALCLNSVQNNTVDGETALSMMINDLGSEIIVTQEYRDGRGNTTPETVPRMNKPPVGRAILGNAAGTEPRAGRLYLMKKAVTEWCLANRINKKMLIAYAESKELFIETPNDKFVIGGGTTIATAQTSCYCFDLSKINTTTAVPKLALVQTESV